MFPPNSRKVAVAKSRSFQTIILNVFFAVDITVSNDDLFGLTEKLLLVQGGREEALKVALEVVLALKANGNMR